MKLEYKKRKIGRSCDEWVEICNAHIGWVCKVDEVIYHICNNGILVINEPYIPGCPRKAMMFRDWVKSALKDEQEWRIEAWQKSLRQLSEDVGTGSEVKSTSDSSQTHSEASALTLKRVESILSEVAEPGMCDSIVKVFGPESNVSVESPKAQLEQLPPISSTTTSSGTQSGQMEIPSLPF